MSKNVHPAPVPDDPSGTHPAPVRHPSGTRPAPVRHPSGTRLFFCLKALDLLFAMDPAPSGTQHYPAPSTYNPACACASYLLALVSCSRLHHPAPVRHHPAPNTIQHHPAPNIIQHHQLIILLALALTLALVSCSCSH